MHLNDSKTTILIVDDDESTREALVPSVEEVAQEVISVGSGKEAIEVVKNKIVGVAILDIKMPQMSGFEAMSIMRAYRPNMVCLFMTGEGDKRLVQEALRLGAYDFIDKPFNMDSLIATVSRASEKYLLEFKRQRILEALVYEYTSVTKEQFNGLSSQEKIKLFSTLYSIVELKMLKKEMRHTG